MNRRKGISFSKSVCPRNTVFTKKKIRETVAPRVVEWVKVEFRNMIKTMAYETAVKRKFSSHTISSSTFLTRNVLSVFGHQVI